MSDDADYEQLILQARDLVNAVLERMEPVLRRAASGIDQQDWNGCGWCPICATVAMLRGEHHDLVSYLAEHGVAMVTIIREAIAGVPVDPIMPEDDSSPGPRRAPADDLAPRGSYQPIPVTVRVR